jgi:hypothetical protein
MGARPPELLAELEVSAHAAEIVGGRWEAPVWDGERMMVVEFFARPDGSTDAGMALFEVEDPGTDPEQRARLEEGALRTAIEHNWSIALHEGSWEECPALTLCYDQPWLWDLCSGITEWGHTGTRHVTINGVYRSLHECTPEQRRALLEAELACVRRRHREREALAARFAACYQL